MLYRSKTKDDALFGLWIKSLNCAKNVINKGSVSPTGSVLIVFYTKGQLNIVRRGDSCGRMPTK